VSSVLRPHQNSIGYTGDGFLAAFLLGQILI